MKKISSGDRRENICFKVGFHFANLAEGGEQVFAGKHCLGQFGIFFFRFFSVAVCVERRVGSRRRR